MADTPILYPPHVGRIINAYVEAACARAVAVSTRTSYDADAHHRALIAFDRMIGQLCEADDAEDLMAFLDDAFSGGYEIRFRASAYRGVRAQREGDAMVVWVYEPLPINGCGDVDGEPELLSDALRAWRDEQAARARPASESPGGERL